MYIIAVIKTRSAYEIDMQTVKNRKGSFIMFKIAINAAKASETASKIAAEIAKKKMEEHNSRVQNAIDTIVSKIEEAMNKAEFRVEISFKENNADVDAIAAAMNDSFAKYKADIKCSKDVLGDAVSALISEAGFSICKFKEDDNHDLPYLVIEWDDPDNDECK
jgi:3'-phosphoadenosine 5'-phosphosulfate sulfotransferase